MKLNLLRGAALALGMCALLVGGNPAWADDGGKKDKDKSESVKKDDGKKKGEKMESEAPKEEPKTGIAALRQRVAELRDVAKDMKKNDHDKAAAKVLEIADALEADINAMDKERSMRMRGPGQGGAEAGREGNKGVGIGHGKPSEPGTGKPQTVGPPAGKAEKEGKN